MPIRQLVTPDLSRQAWRGWCEMYVDDAAGAPETLPPRNGSATKTYNVEKANGNVRAGDPPVGVWVPIFFSLPRYPEGDLGHVAWAFNHGDGWIEIHDSETRPGARAVYRSIAEVTAWFGKFGCTYLGWSYWVAGVHVVEDYELPATGGAPDTDRIAAKGTATVTVDVLNVRNEPSTDAAIVAQYSAGQTFNYDSYIITNGFVWLSYESFGGVRRYVAEGPNDGDSSNVWVSGGVG